MLVRYKGVSDDRRKMDVVDFRLETMGLAADFGRMVTQYETIIQ